MDNENIDNIEKPIEEEEDKKEEKNIEVVTGDGDNLDISPVYSYVKIDKPDVNRDKNRKIIIPNVEKNEKNDDEKIENDKEENDNSSEENQSE